MLSKNRPWSEIKFEQGDLLVLRIDAQGHTTSLLIQTYTNPEDGWEGLTS